MRIGGLRIRGLSQLHAGAKGGKGGRGGTGGPGGRGGAGGRITVNVQARDIDAILKIIYSV